MKKVIATTLLGLILIACEKNDCVETPCVNYVNLDLDPVCGCNGVTYENPSIAECHGIYTYTKGECDQ